MEWSTISDRPRSDPMTREQLREYIEENEGRKGLRDFDERMARVEATGTSCFSGDFEGTIACNRAGPNEETLTLEQLVAWANPPTKSVRELWQAERDAMNLKRIGPVDQAAIIVYKSKQRSEWGDVWLASVSLGHAFDNEVPFAKALSRHPQRALAHALRELADRLEAESRK